MVKCVVCGQDKPDTDINEDGICLNCLSSIFSSEDIMNY